MHDEEIAALVLKSGVHHYISKKQLTKDSLYKGIEKALAVRASIIADYKNQSNQEYNFDEFITGFLIKTEERLIADILRDAKIFGCLPDRRLLEEELERERQHIVKLNDDPIIQEAKIGLLETVAERIRHKSW